MRADTRQRRLRAAVLLVAFAVGVVAGGYAANEDADAQRVAGLAAMIAVEDGEPAPAGQPPGDRLSLSLYNMEESAVTVSRARPLGWTVETDTEHTVPPKQWTAVPLSITPDCDEEPSDRVRLRLHGEGTDEQVTLPVRHGADRAEAERSALCTGPGSTVTVEDVESRRRDGGLDMELSVRLQGPPDASRMLSYPYAGVVAGLRVEIIRPSLTLRSGETATVTARWTVEDCDETATLARGATPLLAVLQGASDTPFLPDRATAALARFGAQECAAARGG